MYLNWVPLKYQLVDRTPLLGVDSDEMLCRKVTQQVGYLSCQFLSMFLATLSLESAVK